MSDTFAERLLDMYNSRNNSWHDASRAKAERSPDMPTDSANTDIYIHIAPDDSITVRLSLLGTHPAISRLVRRHGGVVTKSAGTKRFTFLITDSDAPFLGILSKTLWRELKARSRPNFFNTSELTINTRHVAESLGEFAGIVEVFREYQQRAAERAKAQIQT